MKIVHHGYRLTLLALAALLAAAPGARAADLVWTNLAGGSWHNATNWNPNQVPGVFDHAWVTNNGTYAVFFTNDVTINSLTLGSASGTNTLAGAKALTLIGPLVWQGGVISNAFVLSSGGGQIGGAAMKYLNGAKLLNYGALTLGAPIFTGSGSVISNAPTGTFDFTTNYGTTFTSNGARGVFFNAGLLRKTGGTDTARVDDLFINAGTLETRSGTLRLTATNCAQTAGVTRLLTGGLQVDKGYTLLGGTLSGSNTLTGDLVNSSGIVSPSESSSTTNGYPLPGASPAQLTITGNFSQTSSGTLVVELGGENAGTEYDVLAVRNSMALGGTLAICLRPSYTPPPSSYYAFLSANSISGCFAALNYPLGNAWVWQVLNNFSIISTTTNTAPVPAFVPAQTIPALRPFDLTLTATDAEVPPQTLTWSGRYNPTNLTISSAGQLHWTPTAAQIGTNQIIAEVRDDGGGNCPDGGQGPCNYPPPPCGSGLVTRLTFNLIVTPSLSLNLNSQLSTINLSWPAAAAGWLLERTNFLDASTNPWPPVPPPYQTNVGVISVIFTNTPPAGNWFFRLHKSP